jgi:hypothetical protein
MNIIWNKNPLCTVIELTEQEQELFKLKIRVKELEETIFEAHFEFDHLDWYNKAIKPKTLEEAVQNVKKNLDPSYIYGEGEHEGKGLDARVNELFEYYMADLQGSHVGDCTCVPCSCTKCHAEDLLGLNTIKGLGKHSAYKIDSAFGKNNERTIDEALEHLKNYKVTPPTENLEGWARAGGWEQHVPRWTAEAKAAYEWLLAYRQAHPEVAGSPVSEQK